MQTHTRSRPLPPIPRNVAGQPEKSGATVSDSDYPTQNNNNNLTEPIPPLTQVPEENIDKATLPPLYTNSSPGPPSFHTNAADDNVEEANVVVKPTSRQWYHTITQSKTRLFLAIFILVLGIGGIISGILEGAKIIHPQSKSVQFVTTTRTLEPQTSRDMSSLTLDSQPPKTAAGLTLTPEPQVTVIAPVEPLQITPATTLTLLAPSVSPDSVPLLPLVPPPLPISSLQEIIAATTLTVNVREPAGPTDFTQKF